MNVIEVPAQITQEMADCVGCTPEQYERIVTVARLFVVPKVGTYTTDRLEWPYVAPNEFSGSKEKC